MLVLTRKTQQQIQIGNNIVVTILQVKGQAVRVGIEAPRNVRVIRSEIKHKEKTAAQEAAAAAPSDETPRSRRSGDRVPGGELTAAKPFSSPGVEQPERPGESHGLFPRMRRRTRPLDDGGPAAESAGRFGGAPRGLAMQIS